MKKKIFLIVLGLIFQPSIPANAGQFDVIHKWINPVDNAVYVYIPDQPVNQPLANMRILQNKLKLLKTNPCGIAKVSDSESNIVEGFKTESGASFSQSQNDSAQVPNCTLVSGVYTSNWNPGNNNSALKIVDTWYLKLSPSAGAFNVNIYSRKTYSSNTNDCGFIRIKDSATRPLTQFELTTVNGFQSYNLDSLPTVTAPMLCRKGVEYQPLN